MDTFCLTVRGGSKFGSWEPILRARYGSACHSPSNGKRGGRDRWVPEAHLPVILACFGSDRPWLYKSTWGSISRLFSDRQTNVKTCVHRYHNNQYTQKRKKNRKKQNKNPTHTHATYTYMIKVIKMFFKVVKNRKMNFSVIYNKVYYGKPLWANDL